MNNRNTLFSLALMAGAIFGSFTGARAETPKNVLDLRHTITDSNIVYPESYEADTQKMLEGWYMKNYTATDDRYKRQGDVNTSDATIRDRLASLNTIIDMPFNQIVRSYIDRYTSRNRDGVAAMLGLSIYYNPIFEQALEQAGLPLELKYLPVIESGLNPNAVSHSGAGGLWQFMVVTGKGMGLEVSSLVDERRDPYLSSNKAAQYLKSLYDTYGDWSLAIAAYNCGPGTVNKAIRRAGGEPKSHDFWSIYYYLPTETRGYVPMFIAANYVMNFYPYHNISPVLATKPLVTDTLMISQRVHFNQISKVLDIPVDELRVLNPQFRADIIPGRPDRQYTLILPSQQCHAYIMSEEAILNYDAARYAQRTDASPGELSGDASYNPDDLIADETPLEEAHESFEPVRKAQSASVKTISHKVEPGQTLYSIAEMYEVTPEDIKGWNNLSRNNVRTGQMLRITTTAALADNPSAREVAPAQSQTVTPRRSEPAQNTGSTSSANRKNNKTTDNNNTGSKNTSSKKNAKNNQTASAQTTDKKGKKKNTTPAAPTSHSVKSGENLSTIAKKYGTTVTELKKANNMTGDALQPGDNLKLPSKSTAKSGGKKGTDSSATSKKTGKSGSGKATTAKSGSGKSSAAKSGSKSKKKKK